MTVVNESKIQDATELDPLYVLSIKKVAIKKGILYKTLVQQWVAEMSGKS